MINIGLAQLKCNKGTAIEAAGCARRRKIPIVETLHYQRLPGPNVAMGKVCTKSSVRIEVSSVATTPKLR